MNRITESEKIQMIKDNKLLGDYEKSQIINKLNDNPDGDIWLYELDGLQVTSGMLNNYIL